MRLSIAASMLVLSLSSMSLPAGAAIRGSIGSGQRSALPNAAQIADALAKNKVADAVNAGPAFLRGETLGSTSLHGHSSSQKNATEVIAVIRPDRTSMTDFSSQPNRYHVLVGIRASGNPPPVASLSFRGMRTSVLGTRVVTFAAIAKTNKGQGTIVAKVQQILVANQWQTKAALVTFVPAGFEI